MSHSQQQLKIFVLSKENNSRLQGKIFNSRRKFSTLIGNSQVKRKFSTQQKIINLGGNSQLEGKSPALEKILSLRENFQLKKNYQLRIYLEITSLIPPKKMLLTASPPKNFTFTLYPCQVLNTLNYRKLTCRITKYFK